ncbi:MAG: cytochrome C, partial [Thiovulaceae bacterium]|nr:cytochrome C [Sulfurimonadaceae bacterium]
RECESCHSDGKALGYGIDGGKNNADMTKDTIVDLMTADKKVIPAIYGKQINKIKNLKNDWSRFIDENGTQLQTIGHHFKLSGPLNEKQRAKLDRSGACLSCHKEIPDGNLGVSLMVHAAKYLPIEIDNDLHQSLLNKTLSIAAWAQIIIGVIIVVIVFYLLIRRSKKPKRRRY